MLNNREKMVMGVVYEFCKEKNSCLVKPVDILKKIPYSKEFSQADLDSILEILVMDDYFEMVVGDNKGEMVYCITLHKNGEAFKRSMTVLKRTVWFKVSLAALAAVVTFIVTVTLNNIIP